jgi:HD-GYP domain-containing protein (c-di-GMP phosphodiesterase class II)
LGLLHYPAGLKGNSIPLASRIFSVIDAYDAMVSNRCYRKASRMLKRSSGS